MSLISSSTQRSLDDRYLVEDGRVYLNGMQALVRLMIDQHRADMRRGIRTAGFVSGYPGSPVGGVDDEMIRSRKILDDHHIVHRPGLNEELAATAVFGTQILHAVPGAKYDGVFGLWFGKAPGVDRAADAFHHANFRGVGRNGGVLAVAGDDPYPRSTIVPSDSNAIFSSFYMPVLAPASIQDILDFGLHGYALSRASGLWVGFKLVTDVADSAASVVVGADRIVPQLPEVLLDGRPIHANLRVNEAGAGLREAEREIYYGRLSLARSYARLNGLNRIVINPSRARIGIITGGKTYLDVRQALVDLGIDDECLAQQGIRILKMGMLYPFETDVVDEFVRGLEEVIVVEDKRSFLEQALKEHLYARADRPIIVGKKDELGRDLLSAYGELSADDIARALARRLRSKFERPSIDDRIRLLDRGTRAEKVMLPARSAYFCSGCPHNRSLQIPEGSVVGAGIGCHIMTLAMQPVFGPVAGYTQMGGEGAQWVGLDPFTDTRHFYQNLGDGTFAHSGSLAIRFAIAAGTNITYKILYNSAVAMTGGQDVTGAMSVPDMVRMLEAEGVSRIVVTTDELERYPQQRVSKAEVWHRDRLLEAEKLLAATPGVTVLLNDQRCAAEKRRMRKRGQLPYRSRSLVINERVCEGCGDCGHKSNCLSVQPVETEFGRKTQIHQSSCNQDYSCLLGDCPSFISVDGLPTEGVRKVRKAIPFPPDVALPAPANAAGGTFSMALLGIGGTGVVTVNQVLGMAAFLAGRHVQTYDHTGSSQKAGPVVSHLKVGEPDQVFSPTITGQNADLYLVFDLLVGADANNLAMASNTGTTAVVSTTKVPTGGMVSDVSQAYPTLPRFVDRINAASRSDRSIFVDAQSRAEALLGDHMASNFFLVGAAFQRGAIPLPASAIEDAIRLNGTAVEMNLAAFSWGRLQAADPERVEKALLAHEELRAIGEVRDDSRAIAVLGGVAASGDLERVLRIRISELIAYQSEAYARKYIDWVRIAIDADTRTGAEKRDFSIAVARNLYKLMAYKDEYEVARLLLEKSARAAIAHEFGPNAKVSYHLHPTFLRALGFKEKVRFGQWLTPLLKVLRQFKGVRGTPLDVLGRTKVRRVERELIRHYHAMVLAIAAKLDGGNYPVAVELVEAPDVIRGYESVKLRNIASYLLKTEALQLRLGIRVPLSPALVALMPSSTVSEKPLSAAA